MVDFAMEASLWSQINNFLRQKHIFILTCAILITVVVTSVISSVFLGLSLILSYLGGMIFFFSLFSDKISTPNVLFMLKRRRKTVNHTEVRHSCTICGDNRCQRHKPHFSLHNLQPWVEMRVRQDVDEALEDFLITVLNKYVYTWYREITEDEVFVHELRLCLRFIVAVLLRRSIKIDLTVLITDKLLKAAMQHLDCYMQAQRNIGGRKDTEQAVLDYFSSNLHTALHSRRQEVKYLRHLSQNMMEYLVPKKYANCKSLSALLPEIIGGSLLISIMDVIADPFVINNLLIMFFDKNPMMHYPDSNSPWVEVLSNFVESSIPSNKSMLHIPLSSILSNQMLLYPFMKFMKDEAAVNILQFCLAIEDFNRQILDPDLTNEQLIRLHKEGRQLYDIYCSPEAVDRIPLDKNLVEEIRKVVYGAPEDIVKLRTTPPLFKSYDQAYNLLENTFCPLFYQSDNYFTLLCGNRLSEKSDISSGRSHKKEISAVAKFGHKFNKIKGVFKPATIEGKADDYDFRTDVADAVFPEDAVYDDDALAGDLYLRSRDMSAWRVFIPNIDTQLEDGWKFFYTYIIEVQSIDTRSNSKLAIVGNYSLCSILNCCVVFLFLIFIMTRQKKKKTTKVSL